MWAEEFGIGEMGLSPDAFWSLTKPEFDIKHRAFMREQDRQQSLVMELALMTAQYKEIQRNKMRKSINALRRYPLMPVGDDEL